MRMKDRISVFAILRQVGKILSFFRHKYGRLRLRNMMKRGLTVGRNVYIENGCFFDQVYPYLIEIGDNCRVATGVTILAHDATVFRELGVNRIAPVRILAGSFIGERSIILPGVTIGPNAMIAAGSMVNRDIGEGKVAAGNPARPYANFDDMVEKYRKLVPESKVFPKKDIESGKITGADIRNHLKHEIVAFIQGVPQADPCYINTDFNEIKKDAVKTFENLMKTKKSEKND